MNIHTKVTVPYKRIVVVCMSLLTLTATAASGVVPSISPNGANAVEDGQHSFDWEIGTWHTDVRVLAEPLSESPDEWLSFKGTSRVRPLMDGRENVVELKVQGPNGRIEGLNLRLYEPQTDRWSLTFVNVRDGLLTPAVYGGFHDGVGEFYGDDRLGELPDQGALPHLPPGAQQGKVRAGVLRRRRRDLGDELGRRGQASLTQSDSLRRADDGGRHRPQRAKTDQSRRRPR